MNGEPGSRPVPDPTVLTTEALHREINGLRELLEARIAASEAIASEQLRSVERQLTQVESQRVEQKADTKAAVDAALTAQKEAVKEQTTASERAIAKSETSTKEQLNALTTAFNTAIAGVNVGLADVKERIGKVPTRPEVDAAVGGIDSRVGALEIGRSNTEGQTKGATDRTGLYLAAVGAFALIGKALKLY